MSLYEKLVSGEEKLSLVGLGYVGMPIAVAFAKKIKVVGFDLNEEKINLYRKGIDPTNEVGDEVIKNTAVEFTADCAKLKEAKFHIVAVPTPVNDDHTPDLSPVEGASRILGQNLTKGSVVVFESTVYPGVTEDICVPILEKESGLKCGVDFKIGYSPSVSIRAIRCTGWRPSQKLSQVWTRKRWMLWRRSTNWWWRQVFTVRSPSRWRRPPR